MVKSGEVVCLPPTLPSMPGRGWALMVGMSPTTLPVLASQSGLSHALGMGCVSVSCTKGVLRLSLILFTSALKGSEPVKRESSLMFWRTFSNCGMTSGSFQMTNTSNENGELEACLGLMSHPAWDVNISDLCQIQFPVHICPSTFNMRRNTFVTAEHSHFVTSLSLSFSGILYCFSSCF